jgi:hypothetical protein
MRKKKIENPSYSIENYLDGLIHACLENPHRNTVPALGALIYNTIEAECSKIRARSEERIDDVNIRANEKMLKGRK